MTLEIDDFETGWFGITMGLTDSDIDSLIMRLSDLKDSRGHMHLRGDMRGSGGIADVELFWSDGSIQNNAVIE
jgi:hypothetical protein